MKQNVWKVDIFNVLSDNMSMGFGLCYSALHLRYDQPNQLFQAFVFEIKLVNLLVGLLYYCCCYFAYWYGIVLY